jgi:hypothetical protein
MIKLIDLLNELTTRQKKLVGQGLEHKVYPSNDPDKVYKVGETKYVNKWVPIFKSNPDVFPFIYRTGFDKDGKDVTWVEMERLDTEQFEVDFDVLESILDDMSNYDGVLGAIKVSLKNEQVRKSITSKINEQDPEIAQFFNKLTDVVGKTKPFKSGLFDTYDFHRGQFGYDKKQNIKMLDF